MGRNAQVPARRGWLCALVILGGLSALGACGKKSSGESESATSSMLASISGNLRVTVGEHGFEPTSLAIAKGAPGSESAITFVRTTDETCATEVVFPELSIRKSLPLNQPVTIDLPAGAARTLSFQCGMGMLKGAVVVK